jgi:methylenetetrahydrofolate dehydrogenase (NADP+)/methenyltetrahydrofolate cyclohydrolase
MMVKGRGGDATVTVCHSRTPDIGALTSRADIVVAAMGRPHFLTREMIRDGAVVVDVGINRVEDPSAKKGYRLVGDVDFDSVAPKTSYITPVPGGVGPMTVAMLMSNTLKAYSLQVGAANAAR